jgi:NhaP-type Na+/H+ or K+/H+ antiporter
VCVVSLTPIYRPTVDLYELFFAIIYCAFFVAVAVFHSSKRVSSLVPESCLLIVIGVVVGVIFFFTGISEQYQLDTTTFFLVLLPPIIVDAGYFMPSRAFFDQFGTIILYAIFGTLVRQF